MENALHGLPKKLRSNNMHKLWPFTKVCLLLLISRVHEKALLVRTC